MLIQAELSPERLSSARRAFSTRRVQVSDAKYLLSGEDVQPLPGDLVLAQVDELGKHKRLELTDGRRAHLFVGDEIVVAYGNRYATDQFEARVPPDLSICNLVAAGGIASCEIARHDRMLPATRIKPIGLLARGDGRRMNLSHYALNAPAGTPEIAAVLCFGTSMNAGKTLTCTSIVRGLKRWGYKVAAIKITGTGAGGDVWIVRDAGADVVADFTDAGLASTYLASVETIEEAFLRLLCHAKAEGCDVAVVEIADGLHQIETAALLRSKVLNSIAIGSVFAAGDSMGAVNGVNTLREAGHAVMALSGKIGRSPLLVREAEAATGLRVYSPFELQDGALVPEIRREAAHRFEESGHSRGYLWPLAKDAIPDRSSLRSQPSCEEGRHALAELQAMKCSFDGLLVDILRTTVEFVMGVQADDMCGAQYGERSGIRKDRRAGFRRMQWETAIGPIQLSVPRLRRGIYNPEFLVKEPSRSAVEAVVSAWGTAGYPYAVSRLVESLEAGVTAQRGTVDLVARIDALVRRALGGDTDAATDPLIGTMLSTRRPQEDFALVREKLCRPSIDRLGEFDDDYDEDDEDSLDVLDDETVELPFNLRAF